MHGQITRGQLLSHLNILMFGSVVATEAPLFSGCCCRTTRVGLFTLLPWLPWMDGRTATGIQVEPCSTALMFGLSAAMCDGAPMFSSSGWVWGRRHPGLGSRLEGLLRGTQAGSSRTHLGPLEQRSEGGAGRTSSLQQMEGTMGRAAVTDTRPGPGPGAGLPGPPPRSHDALGSRGQRLQRRSESRAREQQSLSWFCARPGAEAPRTRRGGPHPAEQAAASAWQRRAPQGRAASVSAGRRRTRD